MKVGELFTNWEIKGKEVWQKEAIGSTMGFSFFFLKQKYVRLSSSTEIIHWSIHFI